MNLTTPKIATLIPAYNTEFIAEVIIGLKNQTYTNFDVYIADDSKNSEITNIINKLDREGGIGKLKIIIFEGAKQPRLNHVLLDQLFSRKYEFIHFHLDDDYVFPTFYEEHISAHCKGSFSLSATPRWLADQSGLPVGKDANIPITSDSRFIPINSQALAKSTLPRCINWIGELSNIVFRNDFQPIFELPPKTTAEINFYGLIDINTCLSQSLKGDICFIQSYQSIFRQHPGQSTHVKNSHGAAVARVSWLIAAIKCREINLITHEEFLSSCRNSLKLLKKYSSTDRSVSTLISIFDNIDDVEKFKLLVKEWWLDFLALGPPVNQFVQDLELGKI